MKFLHFIFFFNFYITKFFIKLKKNIFFKKKKKLEKFGLHYIIRLYNDKKILKCNDFKKIKVKGKV